MRSTIQKITGILALVSFIACGGSAAEAANQIPAAAALPQGKHYEARWESLDQRPTPTWFLDAKFGVFIHWGVYSVPAWGKVGEYAEWYWNRIMSDRPEMAVWREFHQKNYGANFDYMDFAPRFTAELYDAKQWASLFKRSGIQYVVAHLKAS